MKPFVFLSLLIPFLSRVSAQPGPGNDLLKWTTWTVIQAIPSVTYFEDRNENESAVKFGLQWQVIPLSYSFSSNKYVSPIQFFFIRPPRRFAGSAELFFNPEYVIGNFKYSGLKKFMFKGGARIIVPVAQRGEYLCFSFGAGYYYQKTLSNEIKVGTTLEAGIYSVFGMLGLKFSYNVNAPSRYNVGLYFKYY